MAEPKLMTTAEPCLSRRARRTLVGFLSVYLVLYVATGAGGPFAHVRALAEEAGAAINLAEQRERDLGDRSLWLRGAAGCGTAGCSVDWCVPVIPGVLLTYSGYHADGLTRKEGIKIVLYYGVGTHELWKFLIWDA